MENIQVNGQRIWGPPSDWTGPLPPHGTEVYVKNIPEDVMEADLYQLFASVGEVYEIRVPVHWNGLNRGYAFVRYTETRYANRAIRELNKREIRVGWQLKVERSIDNNRLFLSAVPNHKTAEEILDDLKPIVDNVKKVYVYPSMDTPDLYRGYAFVEFTCHKDAAIAKRILTPDVCFNLFERKCIAAWANPLPFLHDSVLEQINILFMRNIPSNVKIISIKNLIETFAQANCVEKVKKVNDIAFITFKSHDFAKKALDAIKGRRILLGKKEIEVEWAVPKQLIESNRQVHRSAQETHELLRLDKLMASHSPAGVEKKLEDGSVSGKQTGRKEMAEATGKNRLKTTKSNVLGNESNLTDWQKKFFESSNERAREETRTQNLTDFINNNIFSFDSESEDKFPEDPETARLKQLQNWLDKFAGPAEKAPGSRTLGFRYFCARGNFPPGTPARFPHSS